MAQGAGSRVAAIAAIFFLFSGGGLRAQEDSGIFARKTITIYIGNTAGGTYDLFGRLVARHLGRFVSGHPNVVAENMPGAGTLRAANFVYAAAPKDGTALGIVSETLAIEQALRNPVVQYDARQYTWIGRIAPSYAIHAMWHTSKVQSIEDAKKFEAPLAGTGSGNMAEVIPILMNALIGTKFRLVRGYPSANEAMLAMERGEVEGVSANWATIKTQKAQWLEDHKVKMILQDLPERGPELPDTPALAELGDTPIARQLFGLYASVGAIGRAFFAPPGIPAANAAALREGFAAMARDPEFIADAHRANAELSVATGADLQAAVKKTLDVPEEAVRRAREIFAQ